MNVIIGLHMLSMVLYFKSRTLYADGIYRYTHLRNKPQKHHTEVKACVCICFATIFIIIFHAVLREAHTSLAHS